MPVYPLGAGSCDALTPGVVTLITNRISTTDSGTTPEFKFVTVMVAPDTVAPKPVVIATTAPVEVATELAASLACIIISCPLPEPRYVFNLASIPFLIILRVISSDSKLPIDICLFVFPSGIKNLTLFTPSPR